MPWSFHNQTDTYLQQKVIRNTRLRMKIGLIYVHVFIVPDKIFLIYLGTGKLK